MFEQITILGPGLLGASLAMKTKDRDLCQRLVVGTRRTENREACLAEAWCDAAFCQPEAAVAGSDLIICCTPVASIAPLLKEIAPAIKKAALVTDVGSTKLGICQDLEHISGKDFTFVGAHPMAGSEKSGLQHARPDLFQDAACILTPTEQTPPEALEKVKAFWEAVGTRIHVMSPEKHDQAVAAISHLPHLLASALCKDLSERDPTWSQLSGPGLRDTTRVAGGDPGLWQQIMLHNKDPLLEALAEFENTLAAFKQALQTEDAETIQHLLEMGKAFRDQLNHD
ncbi:MAG: prephenate dehydrogenase [Opitutales bacterium]